MLHTGLAAIAGYEEVENNLITKLGRYNFYNKCIIVIINSSMLELNHYIKFLFYYKGLTRRPVVEKNMKIPSVTMELYKSILEENNAMTTHFPLPGLHTTSANTARTYSNKGNYDVYIYIYILFIYKNDYAYITNKL